MKKIWVVAADKTRARIFSASSARGPLLEVETLAHPEARLHERDLTTDGPGRNSDSTGQGRHAMGHAVEPKRQEAINFARQVCDTLESGRISDRFHKLYVIAAPAFLGMLREAMADSTKQLVAGEVDKNIATHNPAEIRSHLPDYL